MTVDDNLVVVHYMPSFQIGILNTFYQDSFGL